MICHRFCKPTYQVLSSVGITLNALLIVARLIDSGAGTNAVNQNFQSLFLKECIKVLRSPPLPKARPEVVYFDSLLSSFLGIGDLDVGPWFGRVFSLTVDVWFWTSFIDEFIRSMIPSKKIVSLFIRIQWLSFRRVEQ